MGALERGSKWFQIRRVADVKGQTKVLEWMDSMISIVNDIKVYEDSLVVLDEPVESPNYDNMTVDELKALIDEMGLDRSNITLKADLINLILGEA